MNYEVKIKHNAQQPGGFLKQVTDQILLIDCLSFTEAEARATKYFKEYASQFDVTDIKRSKISEVIYTNFAINVCDGEIQKIVKGLATSDSEIDYNPDTKYYLCKVSFLSIDEKTGRENRAQYQYLVDATSVNAANDTVVEFMRTSMADYQIDDILTTKFTDVVLAVLGE